MYAPHTDDDITEMLTAIGVESLEALVQVPEALVPQEALDLPAALSEQELTNELTLLAESNAVSGVRSFLGAGAYRHYIPPVLGTLAMRGEFLTSYTPYQAEVSQGYLQAIYEWQTYIALLTGLEIANASVYDGATALAEGIIMAVNATGRQTVLLSRAVHPHSRAVVRTYARGIGLTILELPLAADGRTSFEALSQQLSEHHIAAVVLQSPNVFGCIDTPSAAAVAEIRSSGAILIGAVAEAMSLGVLQPPGEWGAEIAVGEAQSFGIPVAFGGPYVGFIASTAQHMRRIPGRLVGQTLDSSGNLAYTLTLQAREQHIRRERASSNICTNQAHCALLATIYLATVGETGLRTCAVANMRRSRELANMLCEIEGVSLAFSAPTFNEFVLRVPHRAQGILQSLQERQIIGGFALDLWYPEFEDLILVTATELTSNDDIEAYHDVLSEILNPHECRCVEAHV